jgi:hypothetical protein
MQQSTWKCGSCLRRTIAQLGTHRDVGSADSPWRGNRPLPDCPIKFAGANLTANGRQHGAWQDARSKIPDPDEICWLNPVVRIIEQPVFDCYRLTSPVTTDPFNRLLRLLRFQ